MCASVCGCECASTHTSHSFEFHFLGVCWIKSKLLEQALLTGNRQAQTDGQSHWETQTDRQREREINTQTDTHTSTLRYIPVRRPSCYLKLLHLPDSPTDCQIDRLTVWVLDWLSHCLTGCLPDCPTDLLTFSLANGARVSFLSTYVQNMLPLPGQTTFAWPGLGSRQATSHTSVLYMCMCVCVCEWVHCHGCASQFEAICWFYFEISIRFQFLLKLFAAAAFAVNCLKGKELYIPCTVCQSKCKTIFAFFKYSLRVFCIFSLPSSAATIWLARAGIK